MKEYDGLKAVLEGKASFLLVAHEDPDGDAIGAILSLGRFLKDLNKEVKLVLKDSLPRFFAFLQAENEIDNDFLAGDYEVIILLDNGDLKRTGFAERIIKAKDAGKLIINIDHHPSNDIWKIADINLAFPDYSSTSEIVYELLLHHGYQIKPHVATNLLAGIYYDTGGFQHSNTSEKVLDIVSDLLRKGANLRKVSRNVHQTRSLAMLKLWGIALDRISVLEPFGLAVSVITQRDLLESGANSEDVSGLINLINTTSEAEASLLIYETIDGSIRGSLRTDSDKIDVSKLAKTFGGGGHKKASGFTVFGKLTYNDGFWQIV